MECADKRKTAFDELSGYMHDAAKKDGMETIYERFANQQPQCSFGAIGI